MSPIDMDKFEEEGEDPEKKKGSVVRPKVERFLYDHSDQAFSTREIAEAITANKATVNHTVRKLEEEGLIERRTVSNLIYNRWIGGEPSEEDEEEVDEEE